MNRSRGLLWTAGALTPALLVAAAWQKPTPERAPRPVVIDCPIAGMTTIILKLVPEGTRVAKGDVLCRLDAMPFQDEISNHDIEYRRAAAHLMNVMKRRRVDREESTEEIRAVTAQEDAEADLDTARARLAALEARDQVDSADPKVRERGKLAARVADHAEAVVRSRVEIRKRYQRPRQLREQQASQGRSIVEARAIEATMESEKSQIENLRRQVELCTITAPIDGILAYAEPSSSCDDVEVGAKVRGGQHLLRIIPAPPAP